MKVAVIGHKGKMGSAITAAVGSEDDLELVDDFARADVAVDVTNAEAARRNLVEVAAAGVDAVVGTTGFTEADLAAFDDAFKNAGKRCFIVPNFAISAVLMMRFAEQARQYFDGVEIVELHHDQKKDAPSGTAKLTASKIGGEVPIHSVRLPGLVAHQEVIFGTTGQTLTIRQDSYDRSSFMPGVVLAVRKVGGLPVGLTTGLEAVL
jgi:4-hydroxy-tetrahydrodipicolinate reductase